MSRNPGYAVDKNNARRSFGVLFYSCVGVRVYFFDCGFVFVLYIGRYKRDTSSR
jgi:hypothetical protein